MSKTPFGATARVVWGNFITRARRKMLIIRGAATGAWFQIEDVSGSERKSLGYKGIVVSNTFS